MESAFGVDHGDISKLDDKQKKQVAVGAAGTAGVVGAGAAATQLKLPEHSHYSKKTRKHLKSLPAGEHEVPTKMLAKKPRKLGARKQQRAYVAAMAQERPAHTYPPVPITRYKDGVIQRDSAHSVMSNAMKGRKTKILIEDSDGYRPSRKAGEELVRRGQSRFQQRRLKQHTNLSEDAIETLRSTYKKSSRKANTSKRPHGVVEEGFKSSKNPYGVKRALGIIRKDDRRRQEAAGAFGVGGATTLAATPVRRSGAKVDIKDGKVSSKDAKKILSPGARPGNKKAIRRMASNMGSLESTSTKVIQYKDGAVIPWDGNHRGTARVARGDKHIPVSVIEGQERPTVSAARNAYHIGQQKLHQNRMDRDVFKPDEKTGKHAAEGKVYRAIANASPSRSGRKPMGSLRAASGPSKAALRTKQGVALTAGAAMFGTAGALSRKKKT